MDFLLESADEVQSKVFSSVANLFNLEVDVIFFDTTTTFFEVEGLSRGEEEEFRRRGYSKDGRSDLGQIVIGFAMTRDGIPVRAWSWAGDTSDQAMVEEVKRDLNGWKLGRVVTVMDAGFNSVENRRVLQGAADGYIIGEKMRAGRDGLNRDLKHLVDIRPVYHRLEDRIRSHVLLCWLALLLIRVVENGTGKTWRQVRSMLGKLKVGIHRTESGEVRQTTPLSEEQRRFFAALQVEPPPRYLSVSTVKRSGV